MMHTDKVFFIGNNTKKSALISLSLVIAIFISLPAYALPVDMAAGVLTEARLSGFYYTEPPERELVLDEVSASSDVSRAEGKNQAKASANLQEGEIKTYALTEGAHAVTSASAAARVHDFFIFDIATTVTFSVNTTGWMSISSPNDLAIVTTVADFFDVTSIEEVFYLDGDIPRLTTDVLIERVAREGAVSSVRGAGATPPNNVFNYDYYERVDSTGEPFLFVYSFDVILDVQPGILYLMSMSQDSFVRSSDPLAANYLDYFGTSTAGFTDLGGANFKSASGIFPGSSGIIGTTTQVPTPATLPLVAIGLIGLAILKRRRQSFWKR